MIQNMKTLSRGRDFTLYVPHLPTKKDNQGAICILQVAELLAGHHKMIADSIVIRW